MLSDIVKESKARRAVLAKENGVPTQDVSHRLRSVTPSRSHTHTEERKREAIASIAAATDAAMDAINGGAATVWHNQQQLEAEARLLHQQSQRLAQHTEQWVSSYQGFHQALKALGDIENWAKAIESDMAFISSSLDGLQAPDGSP